MNGISVDNFHAILPRFAHGVLVKSRNVLAI